MARRKKRRRTEWKSQLTYELVGLSLLVIAVVTLARLGKVGESLVFLFRFFLGEWSVLLALALLIVALYIMIKRKMPVFWSRRLAGIYIIVCSLTLFSHVGLFNLLSGEMGFQDQSVIRNTVELFFMEIKDTPSPTNDLGGGLIGAILFSVSYFLFAQSGTYFLCVILFIIGVILVTGKSLNDLFGKGLKRTYIYIKDTFKELSLKLKESKERRKEIKELNQSNEEDIDDGVRHPSPPERKEPQFIEEEIEPEIVDFSQKAYKQRVPKEEIVEGNEEKENNVVEEPVITTEEMNEAYQLPSVKMLKLPNNPSQTNERKQLTGNARKLEETLESFGVKARVSKVHLGPAVTKYEVNPSAGVKVSRIVNLADDLALALAAKDIRIEAPIPGKSAIGIEVPNSEVAIVSLREVLDSPTSTADDHVLAVGLGRDISGEPVLAHLNKMPHLLVAGATGSGKSVCINGIITSILLKAKPHEVKLMMIDPKMVELTGYNGIPHLLAPVVTEPKRAAQALKKVVAEMERRYDLFSHHGVRNVEGYNNMVEQENAQTAEKQPTLPYIVVIVDELADLMMVASGDVEDAIARLAQMARAAGIHMIIATQRPSVDVITGVIKANIPSRIAFGVSSQTDSRTILDSGGAEKLLGRGDMLYLPMGASKPTRIQGAFLSDEEVEEIVQYVISQQKAQYQEEMIPQEEEQVTSEVEDALYYDAVELVTSMNTASVSMLQRRFRIGYTRAARLIDEMELRGIVGPYEGSKPREVLVEKDREDEASHS